MTPQVGRTSRLRGRDRELASLTALLEQTRVGRSGALVVSGEAGVGKTALLNRVAERAPSHMRVERMVASESEMELAFAGLQLLCAQVRRRDIGRVWAIRQMKLVRRNVSQRGIFYRTIRCAERVDVHIGSIARVFHANVVARDAVKRVVLCSERRGCRTRCR